MFKFNENNFLVTTAIDYPSSKPHLGHAYEKICADVIARSKVLLGKNVHFSTGLDEHGSKIESKAEEVGKDPKDFVDDMSKFFLQLCKKLNIGYTDFIRTTEKRHKGAVLEIHKRLKENDDIYKGHYEGFYCKECETFYTEKDLDNGKCPTHEIKAEKLKEESYFFRMSKYKDKLKKHIENNPDYIRPESKRNEILKRLEDDLKDLSISRKTVKWGIPLPEDDEHVFYVWEDALTNYLTTIGFPDETYKDY